LKTLKRN